MLKLKQNKTNIKTNPVTARDRILNQGTNWPWHLVLIRSGVCLVPWSQGLLVAQESWHLNMVEVDLQSSGFQST